MPFVQEREKHWCDRDEKTLCSRQRERPINTTKVKSPTSHISIAEFSRLSTILSHNKKFLFLSLSMTAPLWAGNSNDPRSCGENWTIISNNGIPRRFLFWRIFALLFSSSIVVKVNTEDIFFSFHGAAQTDVLFPCVTYLIFQFLYDSLWTLVPNWNVSLKHTKSRSVDGWRLLLWLSHRVQMGLGSRISMVGRQWCGATVKFQPGLAFKLNEQQRRTRNTRTHAHISIDPLADWGQTLSSWMSWADAKTAFQV